MHLCDRADAEAKPYRDFTTDLLDLFGCASNKADATAAASSLCDKADVIVAAIEACRVETDLLCLDRASSECTNMLR